MSNSTAEVILVGAGVIGSAAALELARGGRRVVVVDKAGGPGHGSTSASSAVVRFNFSTLDGVATAWESRHCWLAWEEHLGFRDDAGMASLEVTGLAMLDVPHAPRERFTPLLEHVGVPFEEWDADRLIEQIPGLDVGRYWPPVPVDSKEVFKESTQTLGAIYTPDAGYVEDPALAAHNLAAAARAIGAVFTFNRRVVEVRRGADRVQGVTLDNGDRIDAPVLVNAAGPWSGGLNRIAGVGGEFAVDVRPMRQEVHEVVAPPSHRDRKPGPSIADMDGGIYLRPAGGGRMLVGGTEPECDPFEWIDDPDRADPRPTAERYRAQTLRAARRLRGLMVPNRPVGVAGVYDVSSDWTPIYDRTDLPGYYVAMGTSGNQFKNAPLAGRFVATLVDAVEGGHDHDHDPVAYYAEHTGHTIDLGSFSRKRCATESTRSVIG